MFFLMGIIFFFGIFLNNNVLSYYNMVENFIREKLIILNIIEIFYVYIEEISII